MNKELTPEAQGMIESKANEIFPYVWPKNKDGEEIQQRVGQNAPNSKKHALVIQKMVRMAKECLADPEILAAQGLSSNEWISVKEKLPTASDTCDYFYNKVMTLQVGRTMPTFMTFWEVKNCPFTKCWLPIPQPPKQ
jgi:hypothetical protein